MTRWDAARLASERQLPKPRKMHGPVGSEMLNGVDAMANQPACRKCGYLCCALIPGKCVPAVVYRNHAGEVIGAPPADLVDIFRKPVSCPVDANGSPVAPDDPFLHAALHYRALALNVKQMTIDPRYGHPTPSTEALADMAEFMTFAPQYCPCGAGYDYDGVCPHS